MLIESILDHSLQPDTLYSDDRVDVRVTVTQTNMDQ